MITTQKLLNGKFSLEMQTYEYGSGEPLLFIHGAGGLMPVRAVSRRTRQGTSKSIAPQFPGYWRIDRQRATSTTLSTRCCSIIELMDELGIPTAQHRRPFDGRDARGGSRGARHSSRKEAGADRAGRVLDRRNIRSPIFSRAT